MLNWRRTKKNQPYVRDNNKKISENNDYDSRMFAEDAKPHPDLIVDPIEAVQHGAISRNGRYIGFRPLSKQEIDWWSKIYNKVGFDFQKGYDIMRKEKR